MDEFCDGWDKAKAAEDYGRDWHANWQRDLRDMIRLHRNHACVVFWSIGNEVHRQTDEKTCHDCACALYRRYTPDCHGPRLSDEFGCNLL